MGYAGLPLDAVQAIIAGVVIGLGVDYAIHYISRYRLEEGKRSPDGTGSVEHRGFGGQGHFLSMLWLWLLGLWCLFSPTLGQLQSLVS